MNPKLKKLGVITASLVLSAAAWQAGAAEPPHGDTVSLLAASFSGDAASPRLSPQASGRAEFSPFAYEAFILPDDVLDERAPFNQYATRLYPVEGGSARLESGNPAPRKSDAQADRSPAAKKTSLPEPGNWAVLVAGLLGVGAIARRRMSV